MEKTLQNKIYRVVLVGPESTGKTFLAQAIAKYFNTVWVEEFLRTYAENKYRTGDTNITVNDMVQVVEKQQKIQKEKLLLAQKLIIEDTDVLQLAIYAALYFGSIPPVLKQKIDTYQYADLYLLTAIDVPWEQDLVRDAPFERERHFQFFKEKLQEAKVPFVTISGQGEKRIEKAIKNIEIMIDKGFSPHDLEQFNQRNITPEQVVTQLEIFQNGIPYMNVLKPALVGEGIVKLDEEELLSKIRLFDNTKHQFVLEKFVPASGAASRMFQFLIVFLNEYDFQKESLEQYIDRKQDKLLEKFEQNLSNFTFYDNVCHIIASLDKQYNQWDRGKFVKYFAKVMLEKEYLNFANLPKAVLPFYNQKTPIEIHLEEALAYTKNKDFPKIHFTISQEHTDEVNTIIDAVKIKNNIADIDVKISYQDKMTDTICVDKNKELLRDECQNVVFRQAGHGALIENLNKLDSDIIFIKNIDNISEDNFEQIVQYKKALAGILIETKERIHNFLKQLDDLNPDIQIIEKYINQNLNISFLPMYQNFDVNQKINYLKSVLNRPIRVCGMVLNQGKAGGGPFWVQEADGTQSLQIVENSQINTNNNEQQLILEQSSHFNPVDLVCSIKNYKGEKFDLLKYRNSNTGFITQKSINGKEIFGYELPGLWNGAMHYWISVFVEVPISTFKPVKTVNDLV